MEIRPIEWDYGYGDDGYDYVIGTSYHYTISVGPNHTIGGYDWRIDYADENIGNGHCANLADAKYMGQEFMEIHRRMYYSGVNK